MVANCSTCCYITVEPMFSVPVVSVAIQAADDLPGHSKGMLRSVCHLQLHELSAGIPPSAVSTRGGRHRRQASDKTPLSLLSALLLDHGNVGTSHSTHVHPRFALQRVLCLMYELLTSHMIIAVVISCDMV